MSAATIDYDALAQKHGASGGIDYDALAQKHGASTAPPATTTTPPPEGFLHSLGSSLGVTGDAPAPDAHPILTGAKRLIGGPALEAGEGLVKGAMRSGGELVDAYKSYKSGNPAEAKLHAINAVPIMGPGMTKATDQYAQGDTGGEMGTLIGTAMQAAPIALGAADAAFPNRPLVGQIPSKARAGAKFESLNKDLANQPVPLKSSVQPLQRVTEIGERGSTLPTPVTKLLQRSQSPLGTDMTFPEARDFQGSLSDLSGSDKLAMNGRVRGGVAQLNKGLFSDIQDAADAAGRGEDYASAMKEYRRAAMLGNAAKGAAKIAVPAAVGGGIAGHYLKKLVE